MCLLRHIKIINNFTVIKTSLHYNLFNIIIITRKKITSDIYVRKISYKEL